VVLSDLKDRGTWLHSNLLFLYGYGRIRQPRFVPITALLHSKSTTLDAFPGGSETSALSILKSWMGRLKKGEEYTHSVLCFFFP